MTNIVGGNTSNLSQPGSSQDGSSPNPLSANGGLDFLSLISVVYEGNKSPGGTVDISGNPIKSVKINDESMPLDQSQVEQIFSHVEKQVSSDDISAFLKGINLSSGEDEINVGISTLQLLGQLSKPTEGSSLDVTKSNVATKYFIKELSEYIEANNLNSDKPLGIEVSDLSALMQNMNMTEKESPSLVDFANFDPDNIYTSDIKILEYSEELASFKKLPFTKLSNVVFSYEKNDEIENFNKLSFLFNSDFTKEENLSEKKAIELKVTQTPNAISVKIFDISNDKIKLAGDVNDYSSVETPVNPLEYKNVLNISIPSKDLAFIVLKVDVNNQGKLDYMPLPISLKPAEAFQQLYETPSAVSNANAKGITEISKIFPTSINSFKGIDTAVNFGLLNVDVPAVDKSTLINGKIDISNGDNFSKASSKNVADFMHLSGISTKSPIFSDEQLRFVTEKLQQSNNITKQELISISQISEFILRNRRNSVVDSAIAKVIKGEFKTLENITSNKNLYISTTDVIGYRDNFADASSGKKLLKGISYFDNSFSMFNKTVRNEELGVLKDLDFIPASNTVENKNSPVQLVSYSSRVEQIAPQSQISANIVTPTKLSVLDAQFNSRIATTLLEQAINSKENFDLILEPETFGKVRVNVSLENLQLDVKLTAENSATLAILRASESILQSITEVNGLKLAEYNVELSNYNQNNSGSRQQKENNGEKGSTMSENQSELEDKLDSSNDDGSHRLNLIA